MNERRAHRIHAARVAVVATLVVLACYTLCAFGLTLFLRHRLTAEADASIDAALRGAVALHLHDVPAPTRPSVADNGDLDDAPIFLWRVSANGQVEPITAGAPRLPRGAWQGAPATVDIGGVPWRVDVVRSGPVRVVAAQSIAVLSRLQSALVLPAIAFGVLLGAATFAGALIVGLRASAPLDLIRRRQAEFTADASHELRTPLSVVEAEVDLALKRQRTPEEYEATLRRIAGESHRLRGIVEDLLWLARADSGTLASDQTMRAAVEPVVAACVDRFLPVAARNGVSLGFEADGTGEGVVQASAELVDRLAGVLIDNACKYAGRDGTVAVTVASTPSRVTLRVDDSGPGIPPAQRSAVFDRFRRATSGGTGSGLGLAIGDSVVRTTGGSWAIGDSPLGGARMEVTWRRVPGADADDVTAPEGRLVAEPEGGPPAGAVPQDAAAEPQGAGGVTQGAAAARGSRAGSGA